MSTKYCISKSEKEKNRPHSIPDFRVVWYTLMYLDTGVPGAKVRHTVYLIRSRAKQSSAGQP